MKDLTGRPNTDVMSGWKMDLETNRTQINASAIQVQTLQTVYSNIVSNDDDTVYNEGEAVTA